jgi:hypothetical protein
MSVFVEFEKKIRDSKLLELDFDTVWLELECAIDYFEQSEFRFRLKNAKSYVFYLEMVAPHPEITSVQLESLLKYLDKVKELFFDRFVWNRGLGRIYKRLMEVNGWNREILLPKKFKVEVETGLVIITTIANSEIEDLSDEALNQIPNLIFLSVGCDGRMLIEVEIINLPKPILSVKEYKKEIISQSEFKTLDVTDKLIIFDGADLNLKNVLQLEPGEYIVCAYQFENKVKVVLSKVKVIY